MKNRYRGKKPNYFKICSSFQNKIIYRKEHIWKIHVLKIKVSKIFISSQADIVLWKTLCNYESKQYFLKKNFENKGFFKVKSEVHYANNYLCDVYA